VALLACKIHKDRTLSCCTATYSTSACNRDKKSQTTWCNVKAGNLESKQAEAERLRKERTDMEKKLKLYESKILHSDTNDVESMAQKAAEREMQLKHKREELEKR
jgi:hypothetical protein